MSFSVWGGEVYLLEGDVVVFPREIKILFFTEKWQDATRLISGRLLILFTANFNANLEPSVV